MSRLKIGVIGTGNMGANHARILSEERDYFDLRGIYDISKEQAATVAKHYGIKAYDSPEALLDDTEAVVIAVPSSLHLQIGLMAADAGRHALIEKPLAPTSAEAAKLAEAFEKKKLKLAVGHVERFNPVITELKKIEDSGAIFYLEAHRYSPFYSGGRITDVSVVEDLMIHDVDLVLELMRPLSVMDIRANGESVRSSSIDFATAMLDFGRDAHAVINASRISQNKERVINIHTAESTVTADLLAKTLVIRKNTNIDMDGFNGTLVRQSGMVQEFFVPMREPLRDELISFARCVRDEIPVAVDGESALAAVKICEEIVQRIQNASR